MGHMSGLHLTKIAFGCDGFDDLRRRLRDRIERGEIIRLDTRYRPKREEELAGGSLFWIAQHRFGLRQKLIGFEEIEGGRCAILLAPELVEVEPRPRRAHQGWRYLSGPDAPPDIGGVAEGDIPASLKVELATLGLI